MSDGTVDCWGNNYPSLTRTQVPVAVPGIAGASAVSSGIHYNCALLSLGTIECWGDDGYGQLGDGLTNDTALPVQVLGITDAVAVSAGGFHACAVLSSGSVECWGRNLKGALGNGTVTDSPLPVAVKGISNAVAVSAGYEDDETCALLSTGRIDCWGAGARGQLGNGKHTKSSTPVEVQGITDAVSVAAGGKHVCAVLATGSIDCWGHNNLGQLGDATTRDSSRPVMVSGLPTRATSVAVAARSYSCAVLTSGAVSCWGGNAKDQLGNGHQPHGSLRPVRAIGITNAVSVSAGTGHACAVLSSRGAVCWGYDDYGQLGNGPGTPAIRNPGPVAFNAPASPVRARTHRSRSPTKSHKRR